MCARAALLDDVLEFHIQTCDSTRPLQVSMSAAKDMPVDRLVRDKTLARPLSVTIVEVAKPPSPSSFDIAPEMLAFADMDDEN